MAAAIVTVILALLSCYAELLAPLLILPGLIFGHYAFYQAGKLGPKSQARTLSLFALAILYGLLGFFIFTLFYR